MSPFRLRSMGPVVAGLFATLAVVGVASRSHAQQYGYNYYGWGGPDPYAYAPPAGAYPAAYSTYNYQMNPFAVGYDLLGGYRPIYSGARQPIGHEMIWTGQNSYVYRPTYAAETSSARVAWGGGPLVIDYPGTNQAKYYTSSGPVWELKPGMFTLNDIAPPLPIATEPSAPRRTSGPREF
jgi:hypothetical protein